MKHLILWGSLLLVTISCIWLWEKTSTMTIFERTESPLYVDAILFTCGLFLVISRGTALFQKIFR